ncbi:gephyrin-like molybdotransferase Glp [Paenibacillus rigui]|uniref:Molybdopterin molybdenumtransferase n=1 Tax=Paenibacillus rigui TaxID=554312 RepID=A0A229UIY7_9BACL|nr:gephyrin-like molybdotransferase Glp [Paenibacillus rigui]OXM83366.1 molybdopterin molybdenumtransferase MoeA [Paenibacillus rigui]
MVAGLKFNRQLIQVREAQQAVLHNVNILPSEKIPLVESFGRRLAQTITADHPVPPFRRSGVDGYAIAAVDSEGATLDSPKSLQVVETILCGSPPVRPIAPGQASRIMTGAVVPEGADSVIMLEATTSAEEQVHIRKSLNPGDNVTPIGGEVQPGELLLEAGRRIGAGEAAILASFGYAEVPVYRKPRVAIVSTGSELLEVQEPLTPAKIRNSNSYMLACLVREAGGEPILLPILPDDPAQVERVLLDHWEQVDLAITTGGVSVGDKDVLVDLFERWDGQLLFNKIAMRPGSPTSVGVWREKLLFALSGNPGACFVGFELFVRPFLRGLLGQEAREHRETVGYLNADYSKGSAYPRYVRGKMILDNGTVRVQPAGHDKSSIMTSIKDTDCLIYIPAGGRGASRDQLVRLLLLDDF